MGHMAINVSDMERAEEFYVKKLGMDVGWRSPEGELMFLRCGGDDLALIRNLRPDHLRSEKWTPLNHFGFRVEYREEVDQMAAELRTKGIEITDGPRDHRDGSRSFYFYDPDRNMIQALFDPSI